MLRFIFSTILVVFSLDGMCQAGDSTVHAMDTVVQKSDTIKLPGDTTKIIKPELQVADTTIVNSDSVVVEKSRLSNDSTKTNNTSEKATAEEESFVKRTGLELFIDYGKLLTIPSEFETKYEIGIGYRIADRWVPQVHIGMSELTPGNAFENGTYSSEGIYATLGLNYLLQIDAKSYLYVGGQYGLSMFEESYEYTIGNPIWPDFNFGESRTDLEANWFAIVIGSEKQIGLKNLMIGGEFTLRILLEYEQFDPVDTYAIPGYGRTADSTLPAVNLYIKYILPF